MITILLKVALVVVLYSVLFYIIFLKRNLSLSKIREKFFSKKTEQMTLRDWLATQLPQGVSLLPPDKERYQESTHESPEIFE
jgi:hypothetical protein